MKKIAIILSSLLVLVVAAVLAWGYYDQISLVGSRSVPEEELQWIPNFSQLYADLSVEAQACLNETFGSKIDTWLQDENKYYFHQSELNKIEACLDSVIAS